MWSGKINTGAAKYDSKAFKKSVGLNGVGTKAVNALSEYFQVEAYREGQCKKADFQFGILKSESKVEATKEENGTTIRFRPDNGMFRNFRWVSSLLSNNCGITRIWMQVYGSILTAKPSFRKTASSICWKRKPALKMYATQSSICGERM